MNGGGRQGLRSGAAGAHHQRQYSDNFLDGSSNARWLQSAGLQHLQSSSATLQVLFITCNLVSSFLFILNGGDPLTTSFWNFIYKHFDSMFLYVWNASRIITRTVVVVERREEECTGISRGALMEEVSIIWSLQRLLVITVLRCRKRTVMIHLEISALDCWICIHLTLSFFLRLFIISLHLYIELT